MKEKRNKKQSFSKPLSEERFNQLIIPVKKMGGIIKRDEEAEEHLVENKANASCIGDVLLFRKEVYLIDVLEESYHFMQNVCPELKAKYEKLKEPECSIMKEIDAKEFLIDNSSKYHIPRKEIQLLNEQLYSLSQL